MPGLTEFKWPLAVKLTLIMTILLVVAVGTVIGLTIKQQQRIFQEELQQQAHLLLDVLEIVALDSSNRLDTKALTNLMTDVGENRTHLLSGRIYDPQGRVVADVYQTGIADKFQIDPLGQQLITSQTTLFQWQPGQLLAGRAVTANQQPLGAVSVGLPTIALEAKVRTMRNQGLIVALVTIIVGGLLALLLSRLTIGPLQTLLEATHRIGRGDLEQKITVSSDDEFGTLALAMESMRAELYTLYQDLEQQVTDKTSDLQKSETYFRQVITSISDYIYTVDLNPDGTGTFRYLSPNIKTLIGYAPDKFMADWWFQSTVIYPDDRSLLVAKLNHWG